MLVPLALVLALQTPDSITLAQALTRAQTGRGRLTAAASAVAEARASIRTASEISNPTLSYTHSGAVPTNHLVFEQPFDWMLRRGPERGVARANLARAEADSTGALLDLQREVRSAFWRARAGLRGVDRRTSRRSHPTGTDRAGALRGW
jgi:Outer membrane efflux protein